MEKQLCPNKELCGSCSWSHLPYEKQLEQKLGDINGSFKMKDLDLRIERILPSPKTEHYRNRMDFVINFEGLVGLRQKGKWWRTIDNHTCMISDERIERLFSVVRDWVASSGLSFFDRKAVTGLLRYAVIRSTSTGETMVNIVTSVPANDIEATKAERQLRSLADMCKATTLLWSVNDTKSDVSHGGDVRIIDGPGYIEEMVNGCTYRITPNAFFQTNLYGAPVLHETVVDLALKTGAKKACDLFCGSGFFSIPLAKSGFQVYGAEMVEDAIRDAKVNAELNDVDVEFEAAKIEDLDWTSRGSELIIVDPPRAGVHDKVLADLIGKPVEHLIYISCNYKSFAREFAQLQEAYEVHDILAIDMFPHTPHVELVSYLIKKEGA